MPLLFHKYQNQRTRLDLVCKAPRLRFPPCKIQRVSRCSVHKKHNVFTMITDFCLSDVYFFSETGSYIILLENAVIIMFRMFNLFNFDVDNETCFGFQDSQNWISGIKIFAVPYKSSWSFRNLIMRFPSMKVLSFEMITDTHATAGKFRNV